MTKPLARRSFLKAMAAAPLVAQEAATEKALQLTGTSIGPLPVSIVGSHNAAVVKLLALAKTGALPEWFTRQQKRNNVYNARISPDVACLRSVSLSAKHRIQQDRSYADSLQNLERDFMDQLAMNTFWGHPQSPAH